MKTRKRASAWDFLDSGINPLAPKLGDIRSFTRDASWGVDIPWRDILRYVEQQEKDGLDLNPDFQRGHVWTAEQQIAFVEFKLRGGRTGGELFFNSPGWPGPCVPGQYVIVDGKQRLHAVCCFMAGDIPAFGYKIHQFLDRDRMRFILSFRWNVNSLETRREVLTWYLEFNAGGTPHAPEELDRVRALLEQEAA